MSHFDAGEFPPCLQGGRGVPCCLSGGPHAQESARPPVGLLVRAAEAAPTHPARGFTVSPLPGAENLIGTPGRASDPRFEEPKARPVASVVTCQLQPLNLLHASNGARGPLPRPYGGAIIVQREHSASPTAVLQITPSAQPAAALSDRASARDRASTRARPVHAPGRGRSSRLAGATGRFLANTSTERERGYMRRLMLCFLLACAVAALSASLAPAKNGRGVLVSCRRSWRPRTRRPARRPPPRATR